MDMSTKCLAIAKAKTKEVEEKLLALYEKSDALLEILTTNPHLSEEEKEEKSIDLFDISHAIQEIESNMDLCRSKEEADAIYDEIVYEMEHEKDNSVWYNIIKEFGENSQEAIVAQDMMELQESVKPAEIMYSKAERDMNNLIKEIQSAREQGMFVIGLDNEKVKTLTKDLSQEQIANIIKNNPLVKDNKELRDLVTKSFDLSDVISKEKINIEAIIAAEKSKHPISYALGVLGSIPEELRQARDIAKNAGLDYQNSLEKAAKTAMTKTTSFYQGAKSTTLEQIQGITESAASIYKEACNHFSEIVENAKTSTRSAIATITKWSDTVLDAVTLGGWSNFCEKIESIANDKTIRKNGGVGVNTYEGRILAIMQKDPNGLIANRECEKFYGHKESNDNFYKGVTFNEKIDENVCSAIMKLRTWALSGDKNYDSKTYWSEIDQNIFGDKEAPADKLQNIADSIDNFTYEVDNNFANAINDAKEGIKKECAKAESFIKSCTESVKSVIMSIPTKTKALADSVAEKATIALAETKIGVLSMTAGIVGRSIDLFTKAERRTNSQIKSLEDFDKNVQEKIQDINKEIHYLSSITPYVKKPYEMTESVKEEIEALKQSPPSNEVRFAIKSKENRIKREEKIHNAKEAIIGSIHDLKAKAVNFVKSDWARTKLDGYVLQEKSISSKIQQIDDKLSVISSIKNGLKDMRTNIINKAVNIMDSMDNKENEGEERD